ncbi:hypothetical protein ACVVIH_21530 [Chryseobacterium arthrosphaerae]|uniref:hypothetical protein n=1 Tax=Chryseobacterium arthrosphaerae TaxID=651561 RepID=UPI003D33F769
MSQIPLTEALILKIFRSNISVVNLRKKDWTKKTFMKIQSSGIMLMTISGSIK